MQNRHPADHLADVRFEIKRLEVEEAKLRAYLAYTCGAGQVTSSHSGFGPRAVARTKRSPGGDPGQVQQRSWEGLHPTRFARGLAANVFQKHPR